MIRWEKVVINVIKWSKGGRRRLSVGLQGSYTHKLDTKGRMVLPARFRDEIGQEVVATIGLGSGRFASIYPADQWEAFLLRLDSLRGGKAREIRRITLASAHTLEVDSAGRILVPQPLRAYAGIAQEVSVNGNSDHLEIWDLASWNDYRDAMWSDIGELAEDIDEL